MMGCHVSSTRVVMHDTLFAHATAQPARPYAAFGASKATCACAAR